MSEDFEKMDKEWLERLKDLRDTGVPPQVRKNFTEDVLKRIHEKKKNGAGLGLVYAGVGVFAFALVALVWFVTRPAHPRVSPAGTVSSLVQPVAENLSVLPAAPVKKTPAVPVQKAPAQPAAKIVMKEDDIFSEIEALRELGVWSEEDEEELGIPAENIFSELELAFDDGKAKGMIASPEAGGTASDAH